MSGRAALGSAIGESKGSSVWVPASVKKPLRLRGGIGWWRWGGVVYIVFSDWSVIMEMVYRGCVHHNVVPTNVTCAMLKSSTAA